MAPPKHRADDAAYLTGYTLGMERGTAEYRCKVAAGAAAINAAFGRSYGDGCREVDAIGAKWRRR